MKLYIKPVFSFGETVESDILSQSFDNGIIIEDCWDERLK